MVPLLVAILLLIMDFGYMFYVMIALQTAARQGVYAAVHDNWTQAQIDDGTARTQIQNIMLTSDGRRSTDESRHLRRSEISVQFRPAGGDTARGTDFPTVEVTINHAHTFWVPFVQSNMSHGGNMNLTAHVWMIRVPGLVLR